MNMCKEAEEGRPGVVAGPCPTQGHPSRFFKRLATTSFDGRLTWIQTQALPLVATGPWAN